MRLTKPRLVLVLVLSAAVGCSESDDGSSGGQGGSSSGGRGGSSAGTGGSGSGSGGSSGATGGSGGAAGGAGGSAGAAGGAGGSAGAAGGSGGSAGSDAGTSDAGADRSGDVTSGGDGGSAINLEGWIPPYEGPPIGPEVKMDCPEDPTVGFTEYKDEFRVEHPHDLPVAARFSITEGGLYNFWVQQGDKRHNPTSTARHPRTEARYRQNFRTGIRLFSADVFWERSVANGTVVMQVHTTTTGIGPVYMVANGNSVSPLDASKVPGGLFGRWINLKVEINSATTGSRYWVNNCLVATRGSGTRGDGNNYFKMGVYHCDSGTCRDRYKNVKLYMK